VPWRGGRLPNRAHKLKQPNANPISSMRAISEARLTRRLVSERELATAQTAKAIAPPTSTMNSESPVVSCDSVMP
jgi:hypothetical protein